MQAEILTAGSYLQFYTIHFGQLLFFFVMSDIVFTVLPHSILSFNESSFPMAEKPLWSRSSPWQLTFLPMTMYLTRFYHFSFYPVGSWSALLQQHSDSSWGSSIWKINLIFWSVECCPFSSPSSFSINPLQLSLWPFCFFCPFHFK